MSAHAHAVEFRTLRDLPIFEHLSSSERRLFLRSGTIVDVGPDRVLVTEGTTGGEVFIIIDGTALVTRRGVEVASLGVGDVFGERAVLGHSPRTATVTSTSDMTVLVLTPKEFNQLLDEIPALTRQVLAAVAERPT